MRAARTCDGVPPVSLTERLDAFQRRHPVAGFPLAVAYKFTEDQGPYLAALITYYGFLSLFPLLLLLTSILGFVLQGSPDLQRQVLDSTLRQFPVIGERTRSTHRASAAASAPSSSGRSVALYGALGVAQAVQNAMHVTWSVPRNRRPNPIRARLRSLRLIGLVGLAAILTTVLSAVGGSAGAYGADIGLTGTLVTIAGSTLLNAAIFVLTFRFSRPSGVRRRDVVPGAIVAAAVWQLLQLFGAAYVGNVVKDAGPTYGVFALVLGLFGWIFLAAVGIVIGAEINVVRAKHLHPRALMTPFTDDVDLTAADQRAYADAATSQRFKGFESVEVTYEDDGQHASARRRAASLASEASTPAGDEPAARGPGDPPAHDSETADR